MQRNYQSLFLALGVFALLSLSSAAMAFGTHDVVKMHERGIPDDLILEKIQYSGATFHLDADDIDDLLDAGVSRAVVSAMLETEAQAEQPPVYYSPHNYAPRYGHPYAYSPYVYAPRPHISVGFGFGYAPRPYFGGGGFHGGGGGFHGGGGVFHGGGCGFRGGGGFYGRHH